MYVCMYVCVWGGGGNGEFALKIGLPAVQNKGGDHHWPQGAFRARCCPVELQLSADEGVSKGDLFGKSFLINIIEMKIITEEEKL